jgi:hypothetical protein
VQAAVDAEAAIKRVNGMRRVPEKVRESQLFCARVGVELDTFNSAIDGDQVSAPEQTAFPELIDSPREMQGRAPTVGHALHCNLVQEDLRKCRRKASSVVP